MKVEIGIENFKGPLDLLLKLITDQKMNILDIPIGKITDQYNEIINQWNIFDLDEASDYILMAARLLQIKSQFLLPRKVELEDEEDPREDLTRQLLQYAVYQKIAAFIEEREEESNLLLEKDPEYIPEIVKEVPGKILPKTLVRAMRRIIANQEVKENSNLIYTERFNVEECKQFLKEKLKEGNFNFRDCFDRSISRDEVITTFLALLELYKTNYLDFTQNNDEIFVTRRECSSLK